MGDAGTAARWVRVEALFHAALAQPPPSRAAWLDAACDGDAALRDEVASLLAAHEDGGPVATLLTGSAPALGQVGPYHLVRELGQGGMGTVYLAERREPDFTQAVALKLLRAGFVDPRLADRLRAERRILARLEHPGIARLIDGGATSAGQPYVVMEYVAGEPLHQYCDGRRLPLRDRLRLFLAVSEPVAFAHRQLVVHRDLKPGNILITPDERPKLLDFGIAKALDPELEIPTPERESHTTAWFTPAYASPEQIRGAPVQTSVDVYALGVLLYELLTGRRPHDVAGLPPREIERVVSEAEVERPSLAVARGGDPDAGERAAARGTTPERLRRALAGDLDTIALTALAKDPGRRYPSVERLADDVRRYLEGQPVTARPDRLAYRVRKFVRRHRTAVGAAAVVVLSLVGGLVAVTWQAAVAARERDRAERALRRSEDVTGFLLGLFQASDPTSATTGDTVAARAMLSRGLARVNELEGQPLVQARMLDALGMVLVNMGQPDRAAELFERGLQLRRSTTGERTPEVALSLNSLARVRRAQARFVDAESLYLAALDIQRDRLAPDDPATANTLWNLGFLMPYLGQIRRSERYYREAYAIRRHAFGSDDPETLRALSSVAGAVRINADYREAERLLREVLAAWRRLRGPDDPEVANAMVFLGDLVGMVRGPTAEAGALFRSAMDILRRRHGDVQFALVHPINSLADWHTARSEWRQAEALHRQNLAITRQLFGEEHPGIASNVSAIASALVGQGQWTEAERLYRQAVARWIATTGSGHYARSGTLQEYARLLDSLGRPRQAEALLREAHHLVRDGLGVYHGNTINAMLALADHLGHYGGAVEAESLYRAAISAADSVYGVSHPSLAIPLVPYGTFLVDQERAAQAVPVLQRALAIRRRFLDPEHPDVVATAARLAAALRKARAPPTSPG